MMRNQMLILLTLSLVAVFGIITIFIYIARDRSLDTCVNIVKRNAPVNWSSKVKIGIIGDSWVTDKKLDQAVLDVMSASGIQAEIVSSGQPGAVSRQVFRNLTSENSTLYSSRNILIDEAIDYLVVIAGINDTVEHMGRNFYAHHMRCIIKAIQARGICPVVVEVPEYGIEITPAKSFLNYAKRLIYRIVFDGNKHDVILAYREALQTALTPDILKDMSLVAFSPLAKNYAESVKLFENPNHLNEEGYQKLGQLISKTILESHNRRLQRMADQRSGT